MAEHPLRLIYMGTPAYAAEILAALADDRRFELALVVSQPDRPQGRRQERLPTAVAALAAARELPLIQPAKVRDRAFVEALAEARADMIVTAAYGRILVPEVLELTRLGAVNVHGSLLPRHRGAAPVQQAILDGDAESGISWLVMDEEVDHGLVIAREAIPIEADDDAASLMQRLASLAARHTGDVLAAYAAGRLVAREQDHEAATFTRLLTRSDGAIDWSRPAQAIERQIRGTRPWPGAYAAYEGRRVKIHAAHLREEDREAQPGTLLANDEAGLVVACGSGQLVIESLQFAGQRRQRAQAIGHNLAIGSRFENGPVEPS